MEQDEIEKEACKLRQRYGLLCPEELKQLRIKFSLDYETADAIFGLALGSFEKFELGLKLQSSVQDHLIRSTNPLDYNGFSILPRRDPT